MQTTRRELLLEHQLWVGISWQECIEQANNSADGYAPISAVYETVSNKEPLSSSEVTNLIDAAIQAGFLEQLNENIRLCEEFLTSTNSSEDTDDE